MAHGRLIPPFSTLAGPTTARVAYTIANAHSGMRQRTIRQRTRLSRWATVNAVDRLLQHGLIERERGALVVRDVNRLVQMVHDVRGG